MTISKFGALNCALIGLGRKILTLALSFYLYGHTMNGIQMIGLGVAISCMIFNFVDKGKGDKKSNSNSKVELADKKAQYAVEYSEEGFARPAAYHDDEPLLLDGGGGIPGGGIPGGGRVVDMALDDIHTPPRRVDLDLLDIMTPGEPTPSKTETV